MKEQRKKIIKNKLHQDLGSELDIELAWSEFKQKKRKKRFVFWWTSLGLLLIISGFLFVTIWNRPIDTKKQNTTTTASTESIEKGTKSMLSTTQTEEETTIKNQQVTLSKTAPKGKNILKTTNTKTKIVNPKTLKLDGTNLNTNSNPSQKPHVVTTPISTNRINSAATLSNTQDLIKAQKSLQKITSINNQLQHTTLRSLEKNTRLLSEVRMLLTPLALLKIKVPELPQLVFPKPNQSTLFEFGIAYQYSKVGRKIKGENIDYLNRRKVNEDFLEANHLALSVRRQLNDQFYLQSGIHFSRYRTKLIDQYQTFEQKVYDNQIVEIIQNGLQEESIFGSVEGTQTQIYTNTRFQQYLEFSLPVQLGWQIPFNQNLSLDLMTGARFSIWNKSTGNTFESAASIGTYQSIRELGYKKAGVITGISSLLLSQQIGNDTKVSAGIQAHYDLTNRLSDKSESDKFYGYGLQIGFLKQLRF